MPSDGGRIAALLTCHNRRELTLACLDDIYGQNLPGNGAIDVFLVDDGSSDGTADAVRAKYPQVNLINGDGNLFWGGGMRVAFEAAMQRGYDFYLWLNDDIALGPGAIQSVLDAFDRRRAELGRDVLIVGVFVDPDTSAVSYGGYRIASRWQPTRWKRLPVSADGSRCDTANGNCVLIPGSAAMALGNIDPCFVHRSGDFDYALRANNSGFPVYTVPGSIGECRRNPDLKDQVAAKPTLGERWKHFTSEKGLPVGQWRVFARRHAGWLWPVVFTSPYLKFWARALAGLVWRRHQV
jgi:GT2 family glycosyltransferase